MKYHIERNTVQETLVIPLYARKMCSELFPRLYRDETALRLIEAIDYDFSALAEKSKSTMQQFGFLEAACGKTTLPSKCGTISERIRTQRSSTSAAGWMTLDTAAATAPAGYTTLTFPMSLRCATSCSPRASAKRTSAAT